ncbi:MAG TPA: VWA domain-containing protein [Longimicrobium sp.]|jgi:Ca-activated chloride channel family protein
MWKRSPILLVLLLAACSESGSEQSYSMHREELVEFSDLSGTATASDSGGPAGVMYETAQAIPPELEERASGVESGLARTRAERYASLAENRFMDARRAPLSTFAIDVDAASYSNVRRFLTSGTLPPADAVRIEELVNYFDYDYPDPAGQDPFSITTEVSAAPWNPRHRLVHVGLQGRRMSTERLPPSNLVFLVDVSGSMQSPDKLPLVQESLRMLTDQLRRQDRVAIVLYAGDAGVALPSTSGADKATIRRAIDAMYAGGSTNGAGGITTAYETVRRNYIPGGNNRVILATDGDFNVGVSSDAELVKLIEREREDGIALTVLGFGTGNYQDAKMEALADHGNGNYAYVDDVGEARKALVEEMAGTLHTLAKDVKVQVEFDPARVRSYRLIGYENRALAARDFRDDRKDAGDLGAGHSVTALYEVVPRAGADGGQLLTVRLRFKAPNGVHSRALARSVPNRVTPAARASDNFRFAAAVAEWGMLLRGSAYRGSASYDAVLARARSARGPDLQGHRAEFVQLVEASRRLGARGE